jgi:glycine betaine/proline transport system substrate-binding protein
MKATWPVAYNVAKNMTFDAKELGLLGAQVDLEGKSIEDVAEAWINANEAKWRAWAGS